MKQLQISVPESVKDEVEEVLKEISTDVMSSKAEKNDETVVEFTVTTESEDIDDVTQELKDVEDIDSGDLSIRVIEQESLIRKGQQTLGSSSMLSQEELYSKAQSAGEFDSAQWALVGISSIIAALGLASDNMIAVIGAMMLAPLLSPFVSGALSITVGDRKLMMNSLKDGLVSVIVGITLSFVAVMPLTVEMNSTLSLVSTPSVFSVLLSVFVGSAAALTFVTGLRDQIAGVAVAIALVPPISSVGLGLKMMNINLVINSAMVASMNMLSLIVAGFFCFRFVGLKPSTYYKKRQADSIRYIVPAAIAVFLLLALPAAYSSLDDTSRFLKTSDVEAEAEHYFGDRLVKVDVDQDEAYVYVFGKVNESGFANEDSGDKEIHVIELQTIN